MCWTFGIAVVFQNHGAALTQKAQIPTLLWGTFVCLLGKEGQIFRQGVSGTWLFLEEQYTPEIQLLSPEGRCLQTEGLMPQK